jgi:hypothetical protein
VGCISTDFPTLNCFDPAQVLHFRESNWHNRQSDC